MVQLDAAKIAEMERTLVMAILLRYRATSRGKYATTKEYVLLFAVECGLCYRLQIYIPRETGMLATLPRKTHWAAFYFILCLLNELSYDNWLVMFNVIF